ncbi:PHD-like_zinc-binding domain-containing protein [Hexamita inflata]|uniref:PHD-like_zinc-binding domain-containing protein n=1 Tax=Hexamita inflata TaxID=28002 RepID=A0ABP1GZV9_9EUKA
MLRYGTMVQVQYEKPYYGVLVPFTELTEDERFDLKHMMHDLVPTYTVRFVENNEATIDAVTADKVRPLTQIDVQNLKFDPQFVHMNTLIKQNSFVPFNNSFVLKSAVNTIELGNPLPAELICSTRYFAAEIYLNQLLKNLNQFSLEQLRALNCLQQQGVVLGRYPACPNYKTARFFGSGLIKDFAAIQLNGQVVQLLDNVILDNQQIRLERIMKIDSEVQEILLAGITNDGFPIIGTTNQLVIPTTTFTINQPTPKVIKGLAEYLDLYQLQNTESLPMLDTDMRYGNNFASLDGLNVERKVNCCAPASLVDMLTAKYQFIQGKIYNISTQKEVQFKWFKLDAQAHYLVDLNVEQTEQLLDSAQISAALSKIKTNFSPDLTNTSQDTFIAQIMTSPNYKCCFCNKPADSTSIAMLHSIPLLKRPLYQTVFNPPIILTVHKRCIEYCPEVIVEDVVLKGDKTINFALDETDPEIIQLLLYDRYMRKQSMQNMRINYENLRKALKADRIDLKCKVCGAPGAVIGCCNEYCGFTSHYDCIIESGIKFQGKQVFCKQHAKK